MKSASLPKCTECGSRSWCLESQLRILLYAFSEDPEAPFNREAAVDSIQDLLFWCEVCGEQAEDKAKVILEGVYRSHSPSRTADPNQGKMLAELARDPRGDGPPRLVAPALIVRRPVD